MSTLRKGLGSNGTQTSALGYGGRTDAPADSAVTESWNGTNWTTVNSLNDDRASLGGLGTDNTTALAYGGNGPTAVTELWNGSNWTEVNDLNTSRSLLQGAGTVTAGLVAGGNQSGPTVTGATESWNGTNWTNENSLNTTRYGVTATGSLTSMLAAGGYTGTAVSSSTEEWFGDGTLSENID